MPNDGQSAVLVQIACMLLVGLGCRYLSGKLGLPGVFGELLGGVLLGPTMIGMIFPGFFAWLFPSEGVGSSIRDGFIRLGSLFFLFLAGLEVDLRKLKGCGRVVFWTSLSGMVLPLALGYGSVMLAPAAFGVEGEGRLQVVGLFLGISLAISALPVIARILIDLNLLKKPLGMIVMAAAMIDDLTGWALFAGILGSLEGTSFSIGQTWFSLGSVLAMLMVFLTLGRRLGQVGLRWLQSRPGWPDGFIGLTSIVVFASAAMAEYVGIHAVFGAFLVGVALAQSSDSRHKAHEMVHHFVMGFFAPLYFVSIGLKADFVEHFSPWTICAVLLIAFAGKIVGVTIGAKMGGLSNRESFAVAFGMNARGGMGIIFAAVGLDFGLIREDLFVSLVIMSMITTLFSGPVMRWILRPGKESPGPQRKSRLAPVG